MILIISRNNFFSFVKYLISTIVLKDLHLKELIISFICKQTTEIDLVTLPHLKQESLPQQLTAES